MIKKKLITIMLCMTMLFSVFSIAPAVSAEFEHIGIKLPDGGQVWQPAGEAVHGYTSGGTLGKTEMACYITATHGSTSTWNDYVTNTMLSGTRISANASISITIYYIEENGGATEAVDYKTFTYVPDSGCVLSISAPNTFMYKGTAGSTFENTQYGRWVAGTIVET